MKFEITAPDGRTLEIEGDTAPSEAELDEIFSKVKPDIDYNKAKVNDLFSVDGLPSDTPTKMQELGTFLKEGFGKPIIRGYFDIARGYGGILNWYADQSRLSREDAEAVGISENVRNKLNTFSDILTIAGDSIRFGSEKWLEKEWIKGDEKIFAGDFLDNPSWTRGAAAVSSMFPSLNSILAFGKENFALGYALLAGSENADIYLEAKEKVGQEKASGLFLAGTAGTAAIDVAMKPVERIVKPLKGNFIKRMGERATRGIMEGLPESAQQVWQNAVKKYGYDETQSLAEGVIESALGGFGAGFVFSGVGSEKVKEKGATDEEISQLENIVTQSASMYSEEINDIAYQDMKQTLNKINSKFANMPEEERMRISRELEQVFGKYYEELSKTMPEEQARSNAALIRNHTFFASDILGISPKEYTDKYGERIKNAIFSEFENRGRVQPKKYVLSEEDVKNVDIPKLTQKDINYARSHPEWKKNADIIDMIGKAGADINEDLETINNALRNYALEEYRYNKENEATKYDILSSNLNEDEQERFAMMVENGTDLDEAYAEVKGYRQEDYIPFQEGEDRNLVAVHSISADNLEKAIDLGGFPVPSIGIVKKGQEFHFGNQPITLVGNKDLIDPYDDRNEVYNRDVWTKTFPLPTYKNPSYEKIKKLENKLRPYYQRTNGENELGSFTYVAQKNPASALPEFARSSGAMLYYLENVKGEKVEFEEKDVASEILSRAGIDEELASKVRGLDSTEDREKIGKEYLEWKEKEIKKDFADIKDQEKREKFIKLSKKMLLENKFDKEGKLYFSVADTIVYAADNYFRTKGKTAVKNSEAREQLSKKIKDIDEYNEWATDFWEKELVGDKMVEVGNKLKPFTLDNIVEAMTVGRTVASQETGLPAMGKVIASGAKKLESIRDIKEEGKRLVSYEESRENMEKVTEALYEFLGMFGNGSDLMANMMKSDAAARALSKVVKNKNITKDSLISALRKELPSDKVSDETISYGIELAKKIKDLARYYFEAKPQRAVGIKEWSAAIIPTDTKYDSIAKKAEDAGLKVARSDNQTEALQAIDEETPVFFQEGQAPKGAYVNDVIYLFENADESSLPHELTHRWSKELKTILAETGSERVKGMIEQIDAWEESEYKRKFNVVKRDNGYAVVNKRGDVVYDNRGNGFLTEEDAKNYAKEELFARGFEQYLRDGKAPNNSLKQAFRNFFMWLKKIYRDAMDLNIQLSPDIKNVYADLLGGTDIDFFLDSTPESFIQQIVKLGQEKEATVNGIIQDAVANKKQVVKNKSGKGFSEIWTKAMIPLSTRAKRISPKLRNLLRRYEFTLSNELNKKYAKITPFMNIWKNMNEDDVIAFDLALKNDYVPKQLEIVDKYNARKEWEAVRETLENIFDEAINAGLDIGYRPDYFPRKVKDVDGFLSYIHNMPEWTRFQQAIKEAGLTSATAEEQAEFINKYLRGFNKVDIIPNKYGSEKERTIDIIDNDMNKFYAPSIEALVSYVEGLNSRTVSSKFLGKGANTEESIGGYLTYLLNNNIIEPSQIDEVRDILSARFGARGVSNRWLANARNYSYMYTMGGINSAITQIEDLSVSMYKAGVWNTLTTAMESKKITKKDLGLDSIAAEFVDQSKSGKMLNKLFKLTGLDAIDSLGKETLVNAELKKFQKMSDETLREYLEPIMEDETNATIKDIKEGNISDNVLYLVFSELSDVQPISLSELPEFYNKGGNLRVLYMLKSFAVKRIDTFRNECYDKIRSKDFNIRKEGVQNLFKLATLMVLCGATKDWLIDLMYGRDTSMPETLLNNILGLVGLSKFQIYQAKEKGFTGTVKDIVAPPLYSFFDDLFTDVVKVGQGKRKIKDMEVWKGIPLVGRFYYWWAGRGREKMNKKNKKKY